MTRGGVNFFNPRPQKKVKSHVPPTVLFILRYRLRPYLTSLYAANICECRANADGTTSLKINFDGWSDTYDYWALSDSSDLFPVGYCEWESLKLQAPKGFDGDFKWQSYLSSTGTVAVPEDLLPGSGTGVRQGDLQVEDFKADATPKVDMPKVKKVPPPVAKKSPHVAKKTMPNKSKNVSKQHARFVCVCVGGGGILLRAAVYACFAKIDYLFHVCMIFIASDLYHI